MIGQESAHCTGNAPELEQIITNLRNAPRTMRGSATPLKTTTGPTACCWSTCSSSRRRSKWTSCPLSAPSRYVVSGPIGELVNLTTNYMNLHEFVKKLPFVEEKKEAKDEFKECFMYRCISRLYNVYWNIAFLPCRYFTFHQGWEDVANNSWTANFSSLPRNSSS